MLFAAVGATGLGAQAATPGLPSFYVDYQPSCAFTMSVDPGTPILPSSSSTLTLPPGTYQVIVFVPDEPSNELLEPDAPVVNVRRVVAGALSSCAT